MGIKNITYHNSNLEKFVDNANRKLEKEKNRKEAKKRLADERKNMLV